MVDVKKCSFSYLDGTQALDNISFSVEKGESLALLGENGAGKSTLIMMLLGFILPSEGQVEIDGLILEKKNLKLVRQKMGIVFQDPDDQLFMPTVYDDIAFGPLNMGLVGDELERRIKDAMEATDVIRLKDKEPGTLSGGEKRRVAIAGVLAMEPDALILDEPTAGLDYRSKTQLINVLKNINATKIIATHDMDFAYEVCGRAIALLGGKIMADDKIERIFKNSSLLETCNLEPLKQFKNY